MATMVDRTCKWCKGSFQARKADVDRGWALFCNKSHKALYQESRTGQNADFKERQKHSAHDEAMASIEMGWDGHKDAY